MPNRAYIWTIAAGWAVAGFCAGHMHGTHTISTAWWLILLVAMWIGGYTYHLLSEKTSPIT